MARRFDSRYRPINEGRDVNPTSSDLPQQTVAESHWNVDNVSKLITEDPNVIDENWRNYLAAGAAALGMMGAPAGAQGQGVPASAPAMTAHSDDIREIKLQLQKADQDLAKYGYGPRDRDRLAYHSASPAEMADAFEVRVLSLSNSIEQAVKATPGSFDRGVISAFERYESLVRKLNTLIGIKNSRFTHTDYLTKLSTQLSGNR